MSPSPRRLTFAVGTSLLTVSLATVACAGNQRVNTRPEEPPPEVNEGPATDPEEQPDPEDQPDPEEQPVAEEQPDSEEDPAAMPEVEEPRTVNIRHAPPK